MARKTITKPASPKPKRVAKISPSRKHKQNLSGTYTVEAIRDKKTTGGKIQYLVKWEGYPEEQCTWEPISNLSNVKSMLEEYEQENAKPESEETQKTGVQTRQKPREQKSISPTDVPEPRPTTRSSFVPQDREQPPRATNTQASEPKERILRKPPKIQEPVSKPEIVTRSQREGRLEDPGPQKKVKMVPQTNIDAESDLDRLPVQGHFNFGDKVKKIISGKLENSQDFGYYICFVEWEKRANGVQPRPTPTTSIDLKAQEPMMLLEFYESELKLKPLEHAEKPVTRREEEIRVGREQISGEKGPQTRSLAKSAKKSHSKEAAEPIQPSSIRSEQRAREYNPEGEAQNEGRESYDMFNNDFLSE